MLETASGLVEGDIMTKSDKEIIIGMFQEKVEEVRAIKGYALAKMLAEEWELLLDRFKRDELTLEQLCERWNNVSYDYLKTANQSINGMLGDIQRWRRT